MGQLGAGGWVVAAALLPGCEAQTAPSYQGEPLASIEGRVEAETDVEAAEVGILWLTGSAEQECAGPTLTCAGQGFVSADPARQVCIDACGEMPDCRDATLLEQWEACLRACGLDLAIEPELYLGMCATAAVTQTVSVEGDFPARFRLELVTPPPGAALLRSETGERAALGFIVALEPGTSAASVTFGATEAPDWLIGASQTHLLMYAADPILAESLWGQYLGGAYARGYHIVEPVPVVDCTAPTSAPPGAFPGVAGASSVEAAIESTLEAEACGNGICEEPETCEYCSDCTCTGESTGITTLDPDYQCVDGRRGQQPTEADLGTEIQLSIVPIEELTVPDVGM